MTMDQIREYRDVIQQINRLQEIIIIIIHSFIYYELDDNIISDSEYDKKSKILTGLKSSYPEWWRRSKYFKQFGDDYNGATGFTLYHDLNSVQQLRIRRLVNGIYSLLHRKMRYKLNLEE